MPSSDIDHAVKRSKRLEQRLKQIPGAQGKGLQALADSVRASLSDETYRQLRTVMAMRNEVVHEERDTLSNRQEFNHLCDSIEEALDDVSRSRQASVLGLSCGCWVAIGIFVSLLLILAEHSF